LIVLLLIAAAISLVSGCAETNAARERELSSLGIDGPEQLVMTAKKQNIKASEKGADEKGEVLLMEDREERPKGEPVEVFSTNNIGGVENGGTPTKFTLDKKYYITKLGTYHWNGGQGTAPGTIGIKAADGKMYGPWKAKLDQKVYWIAKPDTYIPAGSYTVIDSYPSSLAQKAESSGQGMAWASGVPAK